MTQSTTDPKMKIIETIALLREFLEKSTSYHGLKPCAFIGMFHWYAHLVMRVKHFDQRRNDLKMK